MGDQSAQGLFTKIKPYLAIILLQFGYAGMNIITMVSLKQGMSHFILVVYRHAVATLVIAPLALFVERKTRPKMTLSVFLKIMALGFLEPVLDQNLYYLGMKYTSATFASATSNALPALTFILAIIFRLEKVNLKQKHGLAKVIGTAITVTGAMVMTIYKGPVVDKLLSHGSNSHQASTSAASDQHWVKGTIMLLSCTGGWSSFFILQVVAYRQPKKIAYWMMYPTGSITLKQYPAELSLTALICLMGMIEGAVVAVVMERNRTAWIIRFDSKLLAAAYSGIVCSGIAYYIQGVVSKIRGPVFVTAFSPLSMIITAILGAIVLAEQVHLGSLIGAIIIVFGLYSVVWGKSKDSVGSNTSNSDQEKAYQLPVVDGT